jgi:hypothetical protein
MRLPIKKEQKAGMPEALSGRPGHPAASRLDFNAP